MVLAAFLVVFSIEMYQDGHFTEGMVIRTPQELKRFQKIYGIREIKTEYGTVSL